jgi:hypothetical protein
MCANRRKKKDISVTLSAPKYLLINKKRETARPDTQATCALQDRPAGEPHGYCVLAACQNNILLLPSTRLEALFANWIGCHIVR